MRRRRGSGRFPLPGRALKSLCFRPSNSRTRGVSVLSGRESVCGDDGDGRRPEGALRLRSFAFGELRSGTACLDERPAGLKVKNNMIATLEEGIYVTHGYEK